MRKMSNPVVMSLTQVDRTTLEEISAACGVPTSKISDVYACSHQQLDQMTDTRSEGFQIVLTCGLELDLDRWCDALRRVVAANSVLRTRLVRCRLGIVQVVVEEDHVTDRLSGDLDEFLRHDKARQLGFGDPLLRSTFVDRTFILTIHHAIMDYWSVSTLVKEDVPLAYAGLPPPERPAFKEFVAHCSSIDGSEAKTFWASRFKGAPAIFPKVDPGYTPYPTQCVNKRITLIRIGNGVPAPQLPSFVEAAWALTSSTYADSDSIAYGWVLSGRTPSLNGLETTLGPTHAEVPVQVNLQRSMTLEQLIRDRAASLRQLQTHPALQYGLTSIAAASDSARIASGFQTFLNVIPAMSGPLPASDGKSNIIEFDRIKWNARVCIGLLLRCKIQDDGLLVEARYDPTVLCEQQLYRVLNQFEHMLHVVTETPLQTRLDKLHLLSPSDRSDILRWNKTIPEPDERCLHEVFASQARDRPDAVAVEASDGTMSYQELDRASDRLAQELQTKGIGSGMPVMVIMERSLLAICAVLSILKVGGAYVPVDVDAPYDLKAAAVSELKATVILTSAAQHSALLDLALNVILVSSERISELPEPTGPFDNGAPSSSNDLAYFATTSGTTGAPKRVGLEHRCLVSTLTALAPRLGWQPGIRMLQFANHASNISLCEIFGALLFGGCLCIPSKEAGEPDLPAFIDSAKANWAILPPSALRSMSPNDLPSLQSLLSTGDLLDKRTSKAWSGALRLFNGYGASETSVLSTVAELKPDSADAQSIGTPAGCAFWVVKPQDVHQLAPIGSVGELLVEGSGVAGGYLNDTTRTSGAFISQKPIWSLPCGRDGSRFFRTRDLVRYNPDGTFTFVGSQDNRVKIGGQAVQLEEVEAVLHGYRDIVDAAALTSIYAGRTRLVAVISLADAQLPRDGVLQGLPELFSGVAEHHINAARLHVESILPPDKVPTSWHAVQKLPRTASGKLDRPSIRQWLKTQPR